ncbi:MAG: ABC transporter ATP-binding protein [Chloroflexi bacterium]|nr:ABC transporter ATP-binding protein [Chloroflexota bacterium]
MASHHEEEALGKVYDGRLMRRLAGYLRPYGWSIGVAMLFLVVIAMLELSGPYIVKLAIDGVIASQNLDGLGPLAALYLSLLLLVFVLRYAQGYLLNSAGQHAMHDLRVQLFGHVQRLSLSFFDRQPVGRLLTRLTSDVEALNELLTSGVVAIIGDVVVLIAIAVMLVTLNWRLALVTFACLPVLLILTETLRRGMRNAFREVRIKLARVNADLAENVSGMTVVQLFNREARSFRNFDELNRDYLGANIRSVFYFALFFPLVSLTGAVAIALIVWYGGGRVLEETLTVGGLVAFIQYLDRFFQPIRDLSEKINIFQSAMAASERVFALLDTQPTLSEPAQPRPLPPPQGRIELRNVWFAYEGEDWVLRDVSFTVEPGESVAIVGATGAGKTSIISLICRFYDPQRGQVLVDGVDVRELEQTDLRSRIGVVLQDPFLFAGSVARNIRLQSPIPEAELRRAAVAVGADRFIAELPEGYETPVRERGAGLSVGQKQLVSFARALAFDPPILVLDEATSSVDTHTEAQIQDALGSLRRGRTSIVIAHRLATVRAADRILVFHRGRLIEQGDHDELLAHDGIYRKLHELQYRD